MLVVLLAQVFQVVGGEVAYWTVARSALGLFPHEIRAVNRDVSGTVQVADTAVTGTLYVPVVRFSSGTLQRDRDVAKILQYKKYPYVVVNLLADPEVLQPVLTGRQDSLSFPIRLALTVRDCTRVFHLEEAVLIRRGDTLEGRVAISTRFTELGLSPPRLEGLGLLGGLITRANDTLRLTGTLRFVKKEE